MRLIDADELLHCFNDLEGSNDELNWMLNVVIPDVIQDQPTTYDVGKVVEELEKEKIKKPWEHEDRMYNCAIDNAIEIVKQGGISETEQKLKEKEGNK